MIVMDVIMPGKDGAEACREILEVLPGTRVLMLTASTDDDAIAEAVAAGAAGYVQKFSGREELLSAVREVAEGKSRMPVELVRRAFGAVRRAPQQGGNVEPGSLTEREREILKLFASGNSYAQVATITGNTTVTIRNAIYRIEKKLAVRTNKRSWCGRCGMASWTNRVRVVNSRSEKGWEPRARVGRW